MAPIKNKGHTAKLRFGLRVGADWGLKNRKLNSGGAASIFLFDEHDEEVRRRFGRKRGESAAGIVACPKLCGSLGGDTVSTLSGLRGAHRRYDGEIAES